MKRIMNKILLGFALAILIQSQFAFAFTLTQTGANVDVSYLEPTTNKDGSRLLDLAHTSVFFDTGSGEVRALDAPASSASGGGTIAVTVTVPIIEGMESNVIFYLSATDKSGNESAKSETQILRIDRLAPAAPQ